MTKQTQHTKLQTDKIKKHPFQFMPIFE